MEDSDESLVTISRRRASEILSVTTRTLRRWEQKGILHPLRINPRVTRYYLKEVLGLLDRSRV